MEKLVIENARIIFRNFAGKESKFNREGNRNFCVIIENPEMAQKLKDDGWNVRIGTPRNEDDDPYYYLPVSVSYKIRPPRVFLITGKAKTPLSEDSIESLDYAEIKNVDLTINPYEWNVNGKSGVKAYLDTMYVTIFEDVFASKYNDLDDSTTIEDLPDGDLPF